MKKLKVVIPSVLLQSANINPNCGIKVNCVDGAIIITEDDRYNLIPQEVYELCAEFGISKAKVRAILEEEMQLV